MMGTQHCMDSTGRKIFTASGTSAMQTPTAPRQPEAPKSQHPSISA